MEIQTVIDLVEYGGIAASAIGAGVVGAIVTYKRMFGRRQEDSSAELFRKLDALTGRVEILENCVRHLPTANNIIELIRTVHEVDRRLAKIEGFVMGKESLAD